MDKLPVLFDSGHLAVYAIKPWRGFHKIEHYKKSDAWLVVHATGQACWIDPESFEFQVIASG